MLGYLLSLTLLVVSQAALANQDGKYRLSTTSGASPETLLVDTQNGKVWELRCLRKMADGCVVPAFLELIVARTTKDLEQIKQQVDTIDRLGSYDQKTQGLAPAVGVASMTREQVFRSLTREQKIQRLEELDRKSELLEEGKHAAPAASSKMTREEMIKLLKSRGFK